MNRPFHPDSYSDDYFYLEAKADLSKCNTEGLPAKPVEGAAFLFKRNETVRVAKLLDVYTALKNTLSWKLEI